MRAPFADGNLAKNVLHIVRVNLDQSRIIVFVLCDLSVISQHSNKKSMKLLLECRRLLC